MGHYLFFTSYERLVISSMTAGHLCYRIPVYIQQSVTELNSALLKWYVFYSSSPDSLTTERNDNKSPGGNVSPTGLYKLVVPLLRCETVDVRDAAVHALGKVNSEALK